MKIAPVKKLFAAAAAIITLGVLANAQSYGTFIPGREGHMMETGNIFKAIKEANQAKKTQEALESALAAKQAQAMAIAQQQAIPAEVKDALDKAFAKKDYIEAARLVLLNKALGEDFFLYALAEVKKADGTGLLSSGTKRVCIAVISVAAPKGKAMKEAKYLKRRVETSGAAL